MDIADKNLLRGRLNKIAQRTLWWRTQALIENETLASSSSATFELVYFEVILVSSNKLQYIWSEYIADIYPLTS